MKFSKLTGFFLLLGLLVPLAACETTPETPAPEEPATEEPAIEEPATTPEPTPDTEGEAAPETPAEGTPNS